MSRFGHLFLDGVLPLGRRRESSFCRVGSLLGYKADGREQGNDCQGEDATFHSSLPRAILHQDGWEALSVNTDQRFVRGPGPRNSVIVDLKSVVKPAVNLTRSALIETLRRIGPKHTFALARRSPLPVSFLQIYHQRWYIYYRRMAWQNSLHLTKRRQLPRLSPTRFERHSKKER